MYGVKRKKLFFKDVCIFIQQTLISKIEAISIFTRIEVIMSVDY